LHRTRSSSDPLLLLIPPSALLLPKLTIMQGIHPLVRDLYKRAVIVGKDYPHPEGLEYVRRKWKEALRDPENCQLIEGTSPDIAGDNERILRKAVGRGRYVSKMVQFEY